MERTCPDRPLANVRGTSSFRDEFSDGIPHLQQLEDAYKAQGKPKEILKMYRKILDESRSQTLRNVAYMKLGEIYKRAGRIEDQASLLKKALAENTQLIK